MFSSLRRLAAVLALPAVLLAAVVLFWADRSVGIAMSLFDMGVSLGEVFEDLTRTDIVDRGDVPGTLDQLAHALFWGSATLGLGWVGRLRVPVPLTAMFVLGASMAFEFLQPIMSTGRRVQPRDIVANSIGIAAGAAVLLALLSVVHVVGLATRRTRV